MRTAKLLLTLAVACGTEGAHHPGTDPVFSTYLSDYTGATGWQVHSTVNFGYVSSDRAIAFCEVGNHKIIVDRRKWYGLTEIQRKALVYHELGHCDRGYDHTWGIMNTTLYTDAQLSAHWDTLTQEFIQGYPEDTE